MGGLIDVSRMQLFAFCPEDHGLGTPRTMPDIHGGDGHDVLDGNARVLDEQGQDLTQAMLSGAQAMLEFALHHQVELAILTDLSAACGSQVISDGCRLVPERRHRFGFGVAAALLHRNGIPIVSQRDFRTLSAIWAHLDPNHEPDPQALDHHQHPWVIANLGHRSLPLKGPE
jgi:uncharacterized protein YbbK (DUF523 family)